MPLSSPDIITISDRSETTGYENILLSSVNDHVIRKSTMTSAFHWHFHPNSDETFLVTEGILLLDLEDRTLELREGQMFTVPKNVPHRTRPKNGRSVNISFELAAMETTRIF